MGQDRRPDFNDREEDLRQVARIAPEEDLRAVEQLAELYRKRILANCV
jgi:hypothetical protein